MRAWLYFRRIFSRQKEKERERGGMHAYYRFAYYNRRLITFGLSMPNAPSACAFFSLARRLACPIIPYIA